MALFYNASGKACFFGSVKEEMMTQTACHLKILEKDGRAEQASHLHGK